MFQIAVCDDEKIFVERISQTVDKVVLGLLS